MTSKTKKLELPDGIKALQPELPPIDIRALFKFIANSDMDSIEFYLEHYPTDSTTLRLFSSKAAELGEIKVMAAIARKTPNYIEHFSKQSLFNNASSAEDILDIFFNRENEIHKMFLKEHGAKEMDEFQKTNLKHWLLSGNVNEKNISTFISYLDNTYEKNKNELLANALIWCLGRREQFPFLTNDIALELIRKNGFSPFTFIYSTLELDLEHNSKNEIQINSKLTEIIKEKIIELATPIDIIGAIVSSTQSLLTHSAELDELLSKLPPTHYINSNELIPYGEDYKDQLGASLMEDENNELSMMEEMKDILESFSYGNENINIPVYEILNKVLETYEQLEKQDIKEQGFSKDRIKARQCLILEQQISTPKPISQPKPRF